jgi:hypothetical protein
MAKKFIELEVPQTLNDITLEQYQKYMKVMDAHKDAEQTDELTNFLNMKLVEIFCNISLAEVDKISLRGFNKVLEILNNAFSEKPKLITRFKFEGVDMGFIPKLDDMSIGEYIDIETNIHDWSKMHIAMSVLYRPVNFKLGDKYTISPYEGKEEIQNIMKGMPMDVVLSSMLFFCDLGKLLLTAIPKYIPKNLTKENLQMLETHLAKNGDGINQFMHSLKEMYLKSKMLQNYHFSNV